MKLIPLFTLAFSLMTATLFAQSTEKKSLFFETDSDALTAESQRVLHAVAGQALQLDDYRLEIQAHTDARGSEGYNQGLAERRAVSVLAYLREAGLVATQLEVASFGESQPAYTNATEAGMQGNRRVDIFLTNLAPIDLDGLFTKWEVESLQTFTVDAGQATKLIGAEGTCLYIPAGSFVGADGQTVAGPIEIRLREAYAMDDMLMAGLMTTAGEELLISGGMAYLEAAADGQPLQLREGASLTMAMPANQLEDGMQLFWGEQDSQGQLTDWQAAGQPYQSLEEILDMPPAPEVPYFYFSLPEYSVDRAGKPQKPEAPLRPRRPRQPQREHFRYNPPLATRIIMGKAEIEAHELELYEQAVEEYEHRLAQYLVDSAAHIAVRAEYEEKLAAYRQDYQAWQQKVDEQVEYIESGAFARQEQKRQRAAYEEELQAWKAEMEAWKALRRQRLEAFENSYAAQGNLSARTVNQYFYEVNQLGWINCDRFWDIPSEEKMQLAVNAQGAGEERIFVVFEKLNSILRTTRREARYLTQSVPRGESVRIVGLKVENGQPQLALTQTSVGEQDTYTLDYGAVSLKELREALASL